MAHAFIPAVNTASVAMIYSQDDEHTENVYHVQGTAAWTVSSLTDLATAFAGWENSTAKLHRATNTGLEKIYIRDLTTQTGHVVEVAETINGTDAGTPLPNNVTIALTARTGIAGRSFRGRSFWIGLTASALAGGGSYISNGALSTLLSVMEALRTTTFPNSGQLVVASFRSGGAWRSSAVLTPITNFSVADTGLDSQRRRLPFHNRHR